MRWKYQNDFERFFNMFCSSYDGIDHLWLFMSYCTVICHVSRLWTFMDKFQAVYSTVDVVCLPLLSLLLLMVFINVQVHGLKRSSKNCVNSS